MLRVVPRALWLLSVPWFVPLIVGAAAGGCSLDGALQGPASLQLAASDQEPPAQPPVSPTSQSQDADWAVRHCRPPKSLCGVTVRALEQGGFLDFRASEGEKGAPRLLSPFAVTRIQALERTRCPGKLCAAHIALDGLQQELLKQGYYTQSVTTFSGGALVTLRTERIDRTMKVLKGSCRFNLDLGCVDFDAWLQEDRRSGERCGFAHTRTFFVSATAPEFTGMAGWSSAAPDRSPSGNAHGGAEALRAVAFDTATVKVYELVYVHKICRSEMVLIRNG